MKKTHFLFPVAMAFAVVGCSSTTSNTPAEVESVETAQQNNTAWQSADIQPTAMPTGMNQPVSVPNYNRGTVSAAATTAAASTYGSAYGSTSESVGSCNVVRDAMGTPLYSQMTKGCYSGSTYTVGEKDTLFFIAFLTGSNPQQIANLNNISTTTKLKVGQTLRVR